MRRVLQIFMFLLLAMTSGCLLKPREADSESKLLSQYADVYEGQRNIPPVPEKAELNDLLQVAFYSNGDLENAYYQWKAAIARVNIESVWPNSNLQLSFDYLFSKDKLKAWDRTTLGATFDPSVGLMMPQKVEKSGQIAFQEAVGARNNFQTAKFDLQNRVINAWLDYILAIQKIAIQQETLDLLKMNVDILQARFQAGGESADYLRATIEHHVAQIELATMQAETQSDLAKLNALLGRKPDEPLALATSLPGPRGAGLTDETLLKVSVENNPELASLQSEITAKSGALDLAKMKYMPDFNPTFSIMGSMTQTLGAMAMLPTNLPAIEASIKEADAKLKAAGAMARQRRVDKAAQFVSALYFLRNAQSQIQFLEKTVTPLATGIAENIQQSYTAGQSPFADLLMSKKTLLELRLARLNAFIESQRRVADLESLAGMDVETLELQK